MIHNSKWYISILEIVINQKEVPSASGLALGNSASCWCLSAQCWCLSAQCWCLSALCWYISASCWCLGALCSCLSALCLCLSAMFVLKCTILAFECFMVEFKCFMLVFNLHSKKVGNLMHWNNCIWIHKFERAKCKLVINWEGQIVN